MDTLLSFDKWSRRGACSHPSGILVHHYIGNLALVDLLRSELEREALRFPILLNKVLYSGSHSGDYLTLDDIAALPVELDKLALVVCSTQPNQEYIECFRRQMIELVEAAERVRKPISF